MIVDAIQQERKNLREEITSQVNNAITNHIPSQVDTSVRNNPQLQHDDLPIWLTLKFKFERLHVSNTPCRSSVIRLRDQDDHHDDAPPKGKNNSYATDDDELPTKKVSQELVEEMSQTVDEAKLRKVFPAVIFPDDDIKERTSRLVDKCMKKFNPYARYSTYWELGHEHKFITEIIARRANDSIVSITESDYQNLNKNDIEDMYMLIVNGKVDDYAETRLLWSFSVFIRFTVIWERVHDFQLGVESYQQKVNLTAPIITFPSIEKYKVFSIIAEPVYGIIYKNIKKDKRVMRHQEVHKFYDATLKRVLEGLKSYNNNALTGRELCSAGLGKSEENKCENAMSRYRFISGSNINRPELAFEVCPILPAILIPRKSQSGGILRPMEAFVASWYSDRRADVECVE
ncbi:hypothetical protein Tco_1220718 [Tanacetum coccineum]